jgi:hypothetical protein
LPARVESRIWQFAIVVEINNIAISKILAISIAILEVKGV